MNHLYTVQMLQTLQHQYNQAAIDVYKMISKGKDSNLFYLLYSMFSFKIQRKERNERKGIHMQNDIPCMVFNTFAERAGQRVKQLS